MLLDRWAFRKQFRSVGPAVTPVIHALDEAQAIRNAAVAIELGAAGVFLINHDFESERLLPIIRAVRQRWPALFMGVNFLAETGLDAFPVLGRLQADGCMVDAYWADDARIDERARQQIEAHQISDARAASGWTGLYTGGVAFKKQRPVAPGDYAASARIGAEWMDAVCTSGAATGIEADDAKIGTFRAALGDSPLALASGVTPENVGRYARDVDLILVATGVSPAGDFYNIDPARLARLLDQTRRIGAHSEAGDPV